MSVALPVLFAVAALTCVWAISRALAANLGPIADLKRRAAQPDYGAEVFVTLHEQELGIEDATFIRPRRARHASRPKPVTHRLHQFGRSRSAA